MLIGYARVSKIEEWDTFAQVTADKNASAKRIFKDKASGASCDRPELHRLIDHICPGDVLVVWTLDRLSRYLRDLIHIIGKVHAAGAAFRKLIEAIIELEAMTNPRLRDEIGEIHLVPLDERISGPGTQIIMAAFTHLNPEGGRFTDGSYGVFYAANDLETAIAETVYHAARFTRRTKEAAQELDRRVYLVDFDGELHDVRGQQERYPLVYDNDNYAYGQHLARTLRSAGSNGIAYTSVRRPVGECVAVFRPKLLASCRQERHLCYVWDGKKVRDVYEKRSLGGAAYP